MKVTEEDITNGEISIESVMSRRTARKNDCKWALELGWTLDGGKKKIVVDFHGVCHNDAVRNGMEDIVSEFSGKEAFFVMKEKHQQFGLGRPHFMDNFSLAMS